MPRATAVRLRAGLVVLVATMCSLVPAVGDRAYAQIDADPLTVTIDTMTPSTSTGDIQLTGQITNADDQPWRDINILPFISTYPISTTSGLAAATQTPETDEVGHRIPPVFTVIKQLDPGATTTWSLTVPRSVLPHLRGGVYWFGVHALGTSNAGISTKADGRARTFLPVVGATNSPARVHLIVEIAEPIGYDNTGHLMEITSFLPGAPTWTSEFSGHLARLLSVVNNTPGADLLVDPAVVDAATRLADGNVGWLGDASTLSDTKAAAQTWLTAFRAVAKAHQVWALPYGDIDIEATADRPDIAIAAERAAKAPFQAIGVRAASARRSPGLTASAAVVGGTQGSTAFVNAQTSGPLSFAHGVRVVGTAIASLGSPKPGDPYAVVPLRQQILAEAALHVGSTAPVVVLIPSSFSPADPAGFAASLAAPWVSLESLPQALRDQVVTSFPTQPLASVETPLVQVSVGAYDTALAAGATLSSLTGLDVTHAVTRSSMAAMAPATVHTSAAADISSQVDQLVGSVKVTAPPGVTLSGSSGRFSLSVDNGLSVPVTVSLKANGDQGTAFGQFEKVTLPAHRSGVMLANVSINAHGNHRVLFSVTDSAGHPTGVPVEVAIRSVQVSGVIWAFIAGGGGLLGFAIAMRLIRRIRSNR